MSEYHKSVLLQEVLDSLHVLPDGQYIDATLGGGGHTFAIAAAGGEVLGIDFDEDALSFVKEKLKTERPDLKISLAQGNFKEIDTLAYENGFKTVNGILFDLGVSSHQLDTAQRGFSFSRNATLDMRMDKSLSVSAKELVNGLRRDELYELFTKLGEEQFAKAISKRIVVAREIKAIETTEELASLVAASYPRGMKKVSPATKVFQALRIAVNDELYSLREALPKALSLLTKGGRMAIISFHSLEDRIVKDFFIDSEAKELAVIITKKPIVPTEEEIIKNKRARSAKLRVIEKL